MIQGTTPQLVFKLPFDAARVQAAQIIFAQNDQTLFEKTITDCHCSGNTVTFELTQEETFLFDTETPALVQVRILTQDGKALATAITKINVLPSLSNEVLE